MICPETSEFSKEERNIFRFQDREISPDGFFDYSASLRDNGVPIVIDNGGHQCKAGWATDDKPKLIFRNIVAKSKTKKEADPGGYSVGNDIGNLEMLRWALKTQFDRDVVTHYECQEQVFDHVFSHLGINTPAGINHPIVITEPVCNPNYCRLQMSELLFECYHVPSVAYGIDSLFSFYHNSPSKSNALVVSSGFQTSHVLPVIDGRLDARNCKRINLGGAQAAWYMQRLVQLKHPNHAPQITLTRAQELTQEHTQMATDYTAELHDWASAEYFKENAHKIQLPYVQPQIAQSSGPKDDEKEKERRQKQGRRLQEINAKRREEKLAEETERLQDLKNIQELEFEDKEQFNSSLQDFGLQSAEALRAAIKSLTSSIKKRREKIAAIQTALELDSAVKEDSVVPTETVGDQRKRQRTAKAAALDEKSGKRPKEERKQELQRSQEESQGDESFKNWLTGLHRRREEIVEARQRRHQHKQELATRRSKASMQRMRILSKLAYDPNVKDDGTTRSSHKKPKEDTFGQNDDDWMVYRAINKDAGESDSEKEQEEMNELENLLKKHDPSFAKSLEGKGPQTPMDWAEYYQLQLGVERIRVPEIVYQPSLLGIEQAGIAETAAFILSHYSADLQSSMVQNIFVTGGNTKFPNFLQRLQKELLAVRPFQSTYRVCQAADPVLDAWFGARKWVTSLDDIRSVSITRDEYQEKGGDYLKEHVLSNWYIPSPQPNTA